MKAKGYTKWRNWNGESIEFDKEDLRQQMLREIKKFKFQPPLKSPHATAKSPPRTA